MADTCCGLSETGKSETENTFCEPTSDLPAQKAWRPRRVSQVCPTCGMKGRPVQGQTVKALLSVSLRFVEDVQYLFCRTQTCPVVYFALNSETTLTIGQVRERVYQKEPESDDVFVCYCFRHRVGDIRAAAPMARKAIIDDINTGINAGQCACDLRNPQGTCCLGNVRALIKNSYTADSTTGNAIDIQVANES